MEKWTSKFFRESEWFGGKKINWLDEHHRVNAHIVSIAILDVIRLHWGNPIKISSGYRTPEQNNKAGGSKTSQHLLGEAADLVFGTPAQTKKAYELIKSLSKKRTIRVGQVIFYPDKNFIHVSKQTPSLDKQFFINKKGVLTRDA